jgi:hypothetical protein
LPRSSMVTVPQRRSSQRPCSPLLHASECKSNLRARSPVKRSMQPLRASYTHGRARSQCRLAVRGPHRANHNTGGASRRPGDLSVARGCSPFGG